MAHLTVDLSALTENALTLKNVVGEYYAVLKCNAYGHGLTECAAALYGAGIKKYAVYDLTEALSVRANAPDGEILILGQTPPALMHIVSENGFLQTVGSYEYARAVAETGEKIRAHAELDCGMRRSGFDRVPEKLLRFPGGKVSFEGIYTHFPDADSEDERGARRRFSWFLSECAGVESAIGGSLTKHCAASAAALRFPEMRLDACRVGLALYGLPPENSPAPALTQVMRVSAAVQSVRRVKKGDTVGYGCEHLCKRDSVIVTVDAGYADGLPRCIGKSYRPSVNGKTLPFAGRICMDRCMLDATGVFLGGGRIVPGDEVIFIGCAGDVSRMAKCAGTIPYEILTSCGRYSSAGRYLAEGKTDGGLPLRQASIRK